MKIFIVSAILIASYLHAAPPTAAKLQPTVGVDVRRCAAAFDEAKTKKTPARVEAFYKQLFLPVVGLRGVHYPTEMTASSIAWKSYKGAKHRYRVVFKGFESRLELSSDGERTLVLPESGNYGTKINQGLLKRLLLGHPLHPQIVDPAAARERVKHGEPDRFLRQVQADAIEVLQTYMERFRRGDKNYQKLLVVAPTGTGKSDAIKFGVEDALKHKAKLVMVTSERVNVTNSRAAEIRKLKDKGYDIDLVEWGGEKEENLGIKSAEELLAFVKSSKKPVILVSSEASILSRHLPDHVDRLRKLTAGIFFDEAHHSGAPQISFFLKRMTTRSKVFHAGFSATPVSTTQSIQEIYDEHTFLAYLDTPEVFLQKTQSQYRDTSSIANQFIESMMAGDIVGFEKLKFISLYDGVNPVFIRRQKFNEETGSIVDLNYSVVNPHYYHQLAYDTKDVSESGQGIMIANDITEAEVMTSLSNALLSPKKYRGELITSKNAPASSSEEKDILERFKNGETSALISVNKLDEGINMEDSFYYIDLNEKIDAKSFLQRLGRQTRVSKDKTDVQVLLLTPFNQRDLKAKLVDLYLSSRSDTSDEKRILSDIDEDLAIDFGTYLQALKKGVIHELDFWSGVNSDHYSVSESELKIFQEEVLKLSSTLFKGYTERASTWFADKARSLVPDPELAEIYVKQLRDLNMSEYAFKGGRFQLKPADDIHRAFILLAYATNQPYTRGERISLQDLVDWGFVRTSRFSIPDQELLIFREELLEGPTTYFDGKTQKLSEWFSTRAKGLSQNRAAYQQFAKDFANLELSERALSDAKIHFGPLDKLHRAFVLLATCAGHQVDEGTRISRDDLIAWELIEEPEERLELSASELKKFREEILLNADEYFPGYAVQFNDWLESQAMDHLNDRKTRARFLKDAAAMEISDNVLNAARTKDGPAQTVHDAIVLLLNAMGIEHPPTLRLTAKQLQELGILTMGRFSLSDEDLKLFQEEVLEEARNLFAGYLTKTNEWFRETAIEQIEDTDDIELFFQELENLQIAKAAFKEGHMTAKSADTVHRAFVLLLQKMGHKVKPRQRITKDLLMELGLI